LEAVQGQLTELAIGLGNPRVEEGVDYYSLAERDFDSSEGGKGLLLKGRGLLLAWLVILLHLKNVINICKILIIIIHGH